jgi:hypothetical protein
MKGRKHTIEQIVAKLREAEVALAKGLPVGKVARKLGITEQTYYRWRKEYGAIRVDQAMRSADASSRSTLRPPRGRFPTGVLGHGGLLLGVTPFWSRCHPRRAPCARMGVYQGYFRGSGVRRQISRPLMTEMPRRITCALPALIPDLTGDVPTVTPHPAAALSRRGEALRDPVTLAVCGGA